MAFRIRPIHISYYVDDREASKWFLTSVLGMKVVRHEEFKVRSPALSTACPSPLDNRWSKTVYGYGPPTTHFAIQHVYCYKGQAMDFGNDHVGSQIRSLEAIARAKALGVPCIEESENTFLVYGKNGRVYRLIDEVHASHDPFTEEIVQSTNLEECSYYWHELLGIDVIDMATKQFTLFFGNHVPKITYVQSAEPLQMTPGHLAFAAPLDELRVLSKHMVDSGTQVELPLSKVSYAGRNSDYLVILRDPSGYLLYFHDLESHSRLSKFDPLADTRLELSSIQESNINNKERTRHSGSLSTEAFDVPYMLILGMKVIRHMEVFDPVETSCPGVLEHRWCKTVYGYGPEVSHFTIHLIYLYKTFGRKDGHEILGTSIRSLAAIARAKSYGYPIEAIDEKSFGLISPSGRAYQLIDEEHHHCDPINELSLGTSKLQETMYFWNSLLRVPIINEEENEFSLFFGNHNCQVKFIETKSTVNPNYEHVGFVLPLNQLKILAERVPESYVETPFSRIVNRGRDADYLVVLKDPNDYSYYFYDRESFVKTCVYDPQAESRYDLSVIIEDRYRH